MDAKYSILRADPKFSHNFPILSHRGSASQRATRVSDVNLAGFRRITRSQRRQCGRSHAIPAAIDSECGAWVLRGKRLRGGPIRQEPKLSFQPPAPQRRLAAHPVHRDGQRALAGPIPRRTGSCRLCRRSLDAGKVDLAHRHHRLVRARRHCGVRATDQTHHCRRNDLP